MCCAIRLVWGFLCQGVSRHFCLPLSFHSFVRPAPRAFFRPDRIFPSPSRAAAVKDGAFLSAAEGSSLTDASTAAGCRRSVVGSARIRGEPAIGRDQSREPCLYSV